MVLARFSNLPKRSSFLLIFIAAWVFAGTFSGAEGQVQFIDVTRRAGIDWSHENGATPEKYLIETMGGGGAFLDYDKDGWLDIYLVDSGSHLHSRVHSAAHNALYRNNGDGTFEDVTAKAGVDLPGKALAVGTGDINGDGFTDIYVANDAVANFLFKNQGDGTFEEIGLIAGVALGIYSKPESGMGVDFGDYNEDGRMDLIVTNLDHEMNNLFSNQGDNWFLDLTLEAGLGQVALPYSGFGVRFLDYDNDSDLDLVVLNGHVQDNIDLYRYGIAYPEPPLLLQNGGGNFSEVGKESGEIWQRPMVGPVLTLKTNRGQRVRERNGGTSYQAAQDPRIVFGLAEGEKMISLEIRWPSGVVQSLEPMELRRYHTIHEATE